MIAWVALRALYIEIYIVAPVQDETKSNLPLDVISSNGSRSDIDKLMKRIEKLNEAQRKLFGHKEVIYVGVGTALIAIGSPIYLHFLAKRDRRSDVVSMDEVEKVVF